MVLEWGRRPTQFDIPYFYSLERRALDRYGARYNCRWCSAAYTLVCCNPICPATGHRPTREPGVHTLPAELVEGVRTERRDRRGADNRAVSEAVNRLYLAVAANARAYREDHPSRKFVRVELPRAYEAPRYGWTYNARDRSPFFDERLPAKLYVAWETVRVNLADGTYALSGGEPEIPRPEDTGEPA